MARITASVERLDNRGWIVLCHHMVTTSLPARDSEATRARILEALGQLILSEGLSAVGVNALARAAGCDKVLIYRYFGSLAGVYEAFAASRDFWWTLDQVTEGIDPTRATLAQAMKAILRRHAEEVRRRPITVAILAAELSARTPLIVAMEAIRERRALALSDWIARNYTVPMGVDLNAVSLIVGSAVQYLVARSATISTMNGVNLRDDAEWDRILSAMDRLIDGLLRPL